MSTAATSRLRLLLRDRCSGLHCVVFSFTVPALTLLFKGATPEKLQEALANAIPLKRVARPSEIAHSILYFSSPAADYITGQVLSVSGGLTMHG